MLFRRSRRVIGLAMTAVLVLGVTGFAAPAAQLAPGALQALAALQAPAEQQAAPERPAQAADPAPPRGAAMIIHSGAGLDDLAEFLGLKPEELKSALRSGKSLAQVAKEQGKNREDLKNYLMAQATPRISARIDRLIDRPGLLEQGHRKAGHSRIMRQEWAEVARYLGLTPEQLAIERQSGKSLADIARTRGKSSDDLKSFLLGRINARLDEAVKEGRLTREKAERLKEQAPAHIETLIHHVPNRTH